MTVVSTTPDTEALTLTLVAELAAPPERVWEVWADPRQVELWWGPPTWPARFEEHDVRVGGGSQYVMTGPDGTTARGFWRFTAVEPPHALEFEDGFADDAGVPNPDMPVVRGRVELEAVAGGTRMTLRSRFDTREQMDQLVGMGMAEGITAAAGQIDAVLAGSAAA